MAGKAFFSVTMSPKKSWALWTQGETSSRVGKYVR